MRKMPNRCAIRWILPIAVLLMASCASHRRVVTESHTQVVHVRDTVHISDTVISTTETIIREADSAMLAQYGILQRRPGANWIIRQTGNTYRAASSRVVRDRDSTRQDTSCVSAPHSKRAEIRKASWFLPVLLGTLTGAIPGILFFWIMFTFVEHKK